MANAREGPALFDARQWLVRTPLGLGLVALMIVLAGVAALEDPLGSVIIGTGAILVASMHLRVRVDSALRITFFPIWHRVVKLEDIASSQEIAYKWLRYGGWGIRFGGGAVAYSIWGKEAVELDVGRSRKLVIQTPEATELARVLAQNNPQAKR